MGYNTQNYNEQGGAKTVIGGELVVNGTLTVGENATVPVITNAATATVVGGVKAATKGAGDTVECKIDGTSKKLFVPAYNVAANQAASVEATTPTVTEFNALLTKLKAAGLMVAD